MVKTIANQLSTKASITPRILPAGDLMILYLSFTIINSTTETMDNSSVIIYSPLSSLSLASRSATDSCSRACPFLDSRIASSFLIS